jgi:hypothetical protein
MPTFKTGHKTFLAATPPPLPPAGPKEILEVQRRMTEESNSLAQVTAKIQEVEKEIETLKGSAPPAPNFDNARELLLADVALGKAKIDDQVKFDKETHDARKKYDSAVKGIREKVSPLESTFAGLRRKAAIHNRTIENLRIEHRKVCQEYLLSLAEREGERYAAAITEVVGAMARAVAIGSLHKRIYGENSIGVNFEQFDAIGLGLQSTKSLPLTDPDAWTKRFDDAEAQILESLKAGGLAVPFPESSAPPAKKAHAPEPGEIRSEIMRPPEPLRGPDGIPLPTHAITEG